MQVEGRVIIDHALAVQQNPDWQPPRGLKEADIAVHVRAAVSQRNSREPEETCGALCLLVRNKQLFHEQETEIMRMCAGSIGEAATKLDPVKFICHIRLFAFVLRTRKWGTHPYPQAQAFRD
jgi:hypothetical protein